MPQSPSRKTAAATSAGPLLSASTAFSVLLVVRLLSAAYATIPDCDEGASPPLSLPRFHSPR